MSFIRKLCCCHKTNGEANGISVHDENISDQAAAAVQVQDQLDNRHVNPAPSLVDTASQVLITDNSAPSEPSKTIEENFASEVIEAAVLENNAIVNENQSKTVLSEPLHAAESNAIRSSSSQVSNESSVFETFITLTKIKEVTDEEYSSNESIPMPAPPIPVKRHSSHAAFMGKTRLNETQLNRCSINEEHETNVDTINNAANSKASQLTLAGQKMSVSEKLKAATIGVNNRDSCTRQIFLDDMSKPVYLNMRATQPKTRTKSYADDEDEESPYRRLLCYTDKRNGKEPTAVYINSAQKLVYADLDLPPTKADAPIRNWRREHCIEYMDGTSIDFERTKALAMLASERERMFTPANQQDRSETNTPTNMPLSPFPFNEDVRFNMDEYDEYIVIKASRVVDRTRPRIAPKRSNSESRLRIFGRRFNQSQANAAQKPTQVQSNSEPVRDDDDGELINEVFLTSPPESKPSTPRQIQAPHKASRTIGKEADPYLVEISDTSSSLPSKIHLDAANALFAADQMRCTAATVEEGKTLPKPAVHDDEQHTEYLCLVQSSGYTKEVKDFNAEESNEVKTSRSNERDGCQQQLTSTTKVRNNCGDQMTTDIESVTKLKTTVKKQTYFTFDNDNYNVPDSPSNKISCENATTSAVSSSSSSAWTQDAIGNDCEAKKKFSPDDHQISHDSNKFLCRLLHELVKRSDNDTEISRLNKCLARFEQVRHNDAKKSGNLGCTNQNRLLNQRAIAADNTFNSDGKANGAFCQLEQKIIQSGTASNNLQTDESSKVLDQGAEGACKFNGGNDQIHLGAKSSVMNGGMVQDDNNHPQQWRKTTDSSMVALWSRLDSRFDEATQTRVFRALPGCTTVSSVINKILPLLEKEHLSTVEENALFQDLITLGSTD